MNIANEKKGKVLLIDNDPERIKMIGSVLSGMNYVLDLAKNGRQVMELLGKSNYDLVLLDIHRPKAEGYETAKTIRTNECFVDLPIIFLTINPHYEQLMPGFDGGGCDYILKPFKAKELLVRVNVQLARKLKADQEKQNAAERVKLNATKDEFFSLIAHDLRNPFAGMVMSSSALLKQLRKISTRETEVFLQEFNQTARRGLDLVENLLDWSKSQSDLLTVSHRDVPIKRLVDDSMALIVNQTQRKHICVVNEIPEGRMVNTDARIMETILRNVLLNAVKFSPESGTVRITLLKKPQFLQVSVIDGRIVIPEDTLGNLLRIDKDAFKRLGPLNETGNGLGLIISNDLMACLGGKMRVESSEGAGCAVHLSIPRKRCR